MKAHPLVNPLTVWIWHDNTEFLDSYVFEFTEYYLFLLAK